MPTLNAIRERTLQRGVNPLIYWPVRAILIPFFLAYFRLERIGREHIPGSGPVILAANHRSFLDPFVIGALTRRPVYYMAKRELFERPWQGWILGSLGAFPTVQIAAGATSTPCPPPARSSKEAIAWSSSPRAPASGLARSTSPIGALGRLALPTGARVGFAGRRDG